MNIAYRIGAVAVAAWFLYLMAALLTDGVITDPAKFAGLLLVALLGVIFFSIYFILVFICHAVIHRKKSRG